MGKAVLALICTMFILLISAAIGIVVMIKGWGLSITSWGWIIGGIAWNMFSVVLMSIVNLLMKD